ncbi:MAG: NADPH:quinone reductase [Pseudomonadota bacterium]
MRAITYDRFGDAHDVLALEDLPTPSPKNGEVLVRLATSGVNPSDVRARAGGRPGVVTPPFPKIIPHSDGAGVIEAVGEGVPASRVGQRVWIWNGQWKRAFGTAAEYIAAPSEQAPPLPDHISFEDGACLGIPALTACHAVLGRGPVRGLNVLVSGGAGTVGRLAVQAAVASGATVFTTVRGAASEADMRGLGAHHVFDYGDEDLSEQILAASSGAPMDRIIEVEFGKNLKTDTAVIAEGGVITSYGSATDMTPVLPFYPLMFKAVTIELMLVYVLRKDARDRAVAAWDALLHAKALDFQIGVVFALADCAQAHGKAAAGGRNGAIILSC